MTDTRISWDGGVAFFTCGDSDRAALDMNLDRVGLRKFTPDMRPDVAILRDALTEILGSPTSLIRPLSNRDGFSVVREKRGSDENEYVNDLKATVLEGQDPQLTPASHVNAADVLDKYRTLKSVLTGPQVSAALVKIVAHLGGVRPAPELHHLRHPPARRVRRARHAGRARHQRQAGRPAQRPAVGQAGPRQGAVRHRRVTLTARRKG